MTRKINYEIVKQEFEDCGYILLSTEYHNNSTYLEYLCSRHLDKGVQTITYANFARGRRCGYCSKRKKRTQEDYIHDLALKKPNIEVLGQYQGLKVKVLHRCKVCEYEWEAIPDNLLHNKNGCPKCGKRAKIKHEEFVQRLQEINSDIEALGDYTAHATKILFQCKKCEHIWEAKPNNILNGKGCPKCHNSKGEQRVQEVLDKYSIDYDIQYTFEECRCEHKLVFDFYIPTYNTCIEYDGLQHFEPCTFGGISNTQAIKNLEICKQRDRIKDIFCDTHGINLIRIPYTEYENIEHIITSIIC